MKNRIKVIHKITPYLKGNKKSLVFIVIATLFLAIFSLISPYIFQYLIDQVLLPKRTDKFIIVIGLLVSVFLLKLLCEVVIQTNSNKIQNRFTYHMRLNVWHNLLKLPYNKYSVYGFGDLTTRIHDDISALSNFLKEQTADYYSAWLIVFGSLTICLLVSPIITAICIVALSMVMILDVTAANGMKNANEKIRITHNSYFTFLYDTLIHWYNIKTLNAEHDVKSEFQKYRGVLSKLGYKFIRFWGLSEVLLDIKLNYLSRIMVYIIGAGFVINGYFSFGTLVLFSECFGILSANLDIIVKGNISLIANYPYYNRVFDLLDLDLSCSNKPLPKIRKIEFINVSFSYTKNDLILNNISLSIHSGDFAAISGESGCGKTTLIRLMLGMYSPSNGKIYIDNSDLSNYSRSAYYSKISSVLQDTFLFQMSLRDNLSLGKNFDDGELIKVLEQCGLKEYYKNLKRGLDTEISEENSLSGGQKQRILIARALLRKPDVLILDEATSSLDPATEQDIINLIKYLDSQMIKIIITHRPEIIRQADRVFIIKNGNILEETCALRN